MYLGFMVYHVGFGVQSLLFGGSCQGKIGSWGLSGGALEFKVGSRAWELAFCRQLVGETLNPKPPFGLVRRVVAQGCMCWRETKSRFSLKTHKAWV